MYPSTGGFARPAPPARAAGDRWERVGHFTVSAAIAALFAIVVGSLVCGGGGGGGLERVTL